MPTSGGRGYPGQATESGGFDKSMLHRWSKSNTRPTRETLPILLPLLLAVLIPTLCVLWFMNRAMQNERLAVREKLIEVYRGQVLKARDRIDARWDERNAILNASTQAQTPARRFAHIVQSGAADSVILRDAAGRILYPHNLSPAGSPSGAAPPEWAEAERLEFQNANPAAAERIYARIAQTAQNPTLAARALQARARTLAKSNRPAEAVAVLTGDLAKPDYRSATDPGGRLIAPEADLFALSLAPVPPVFDRLHKRLNDYTDPVIPPAQRRFLMHRMQALLPAGSGHRFPTLAAEDLAATYLDPERTLPQSTALSRTDVPDLWSLSTPDKTVLALLTTRTLTGEIHDALTHNAQLTGAELRVLRPDDPAPRTEPLFTLPAGRHLPGWTLALFLTGSDPFAAAVQKQRFIYLWTAVLVIGAVAALTGLVTLYLVRQMRLTRLKNDFLATVSHELKTPLASMRLLVDTLLEGRCRDETQSREYLEMIARENARLSRLIDNFLTFSRMERNKWVFDFAQVHPRQIVLMAHDAVRDRFAAAEFDLKLDIAPNLPPITADHDALVTVLINLLDNALKYAENEKQVTVRAYATNDAVCFEVADKGIGLTRRDIKRIFDRFYQVDQTLSRKTGGCGLGLSIVKFIIDAHAGTITVDSQLGKGSRFAISIPTQQHAQ